VKPAVAPAARVDSPQMARLPCWVQLPVPPAARSDGQILADEQVYGQILADVQGHGVSS
jgi:hypothetical protein